MDYLEMKEAMGRMVDDWGGKDFLLAAWMVLREKRYDTQGLCYVHPVKKEVQA